MNSSQKEAPEDNATVPTAAISTETNHLQKRTSILSGRLIFMAPLSGTPDGFSWMDRHLPLESTLSAESRIIIKSGGKIVAWIHISKTYDNYLDIEHIYSTLSIAGLQGLITTLGKYRELHISLDTNKAHSIMRYLHTVLSDFDLSYGQINTDA